MKYISSCVRAREQEILISLCVKTTLHNLLNFKSILSKREKQKNQYQETREEENFTEQNHIQFMLPITAFYHESFVNL